VLPDSCGRHGPCTGEFAPRDKQTGDSVLAGTLNQSQPVEVEVTRLGPDSSASSLVQLLERAASEKPRIAELADRGSRHFVLSTLIITALIGLVWWWIAPERAFWVVISLIGVGRQVLAGPGGEPEIGTPPLP